MYLALLKPKAQHVVSGSEVLQIKYLYHKFLSCKHTESSNNKQNIFYTASNSTSRTSRCKEKP